MIRTTTALAAFVFALGGAAASSAAEFSGDDIEATARVAFADQRIERREHGGWVAAMLEQHALTTRRRWTLLAEPALAVKKPTTGLWSRHFQPRHKAGLSVLEALEGRRRRAAERAYGSSAECSRALSGGG
jgi:hypothetical protein